MSNEHVIKNDIINNNCNIYFLYDNEHKLVNIKLDTKERYIKSFTDIDLDITVVELLEKDNINDDYFLSNDTSVIGNNLINSLIYIPQYPKGEELKISKGILKVINNYEFTHLASTENCSSGSPIFLENSFTVLGIHKQGNKNKTENYGDFIYPAIKIIKKDISKKRNNGKFINGKYIYNDKKYYLGQFKNNVPNGKGTKYYPNGNILYEGDFIDGKFKGKGKYIYDNGDYYIGQFKNNRRNGKGKIYGADGNCHFEGNFIDNEPKGEVTMFNQDGRSFLSQPKNIIINKDKNNINQKKYQNQSKNIINNNYKINNNDNFKINQNNSNNNNKTNDNRNDDMNKVYIFPFVGLNKVGSTFMNATLQCLLHISELNSYFLNEYPNDYKILNTKNALVETKGNISLVYYYLVQRVYMKNINYLNNSNMNVTFTPKEFLETIEKYNTKIRFYEWNNSKDLILYLLQTIHKELNYFGDKSYPVNLMKPNQLNSIYTFNYFWVTYNVQNFSIVSKLFYGTYEKTIKCLNCNMLYFSYQKFEFISFSTYNYKNNIFNIYDGFKDNQVIEYLKGDKQCYCPNCHNLHDW